MSSGDVHLSYAATACNYHFCLPVVQLWSCVFHGYRHAIRICSCIICSHRRELPFICSSRSVVLMHVLVSHLVSILFLMSCSFVIILSTLFRGLLMESILHHLAGRNIPTEQHRCWLPPPQSPSTSTLNIDPCEDLQVPFCTPFNEDFTSPRTATT